MAHPYATYVHNLVGSLPESIRSMQEFVISSKPTVLLFLSSVTIVEWIYIGVFLVTLGITGALLLFPKPPPSAVDSDLDNAANIAIQQVEVKQPRLIRSVLRNGKTYRQEIEEDPFNITSKLTGNGTIRTPSIVSRGKSKIASPASPETPTPGLGFRKSSNSNVPTPFANIFNQQDFSVLERDAPETYKTLRSAGLLNHDGTPTKKLLARRNLPWDMGVKKMEY